jgi:hypothetical protein
MQMDQEIFKLGLSVEATSLYILLCSVMDQGLEPTLENLRPRWAGGEEKLQKAVDELLRAGVIQGPAPRTEQDHLHPNPRDRWTVLS